MITMIYIGIALFAFIAYRKVSNNNEVQPKGSYEWEIEYK